MVETLRQIIAAAEDFGEPTVTSSSEERAWPPGDFEAID
jgi:hypothetical protein